MGKKGQAKNQNQPSAAEMPIRFSGPGPESLMESVCKRASASDSVTEMLRAFFRVFGIAAFDDYPEIAKQVFGDDSPEIQKAMNQKRECFGWDRSSESVQGALVYLRHLAAVTECDALQSVPILASRQSHEVLLGHVEVLCSKMDWRMPMLPDVTKISTSQQAVKFVRAVDDWIQARECELCGSSTLGVEQVRTHPALTRPTFKKLANGWRIDWFDDVGHEGNEVDDLKGFDYIAQLIGTPHVSVPTVRLLGIESDPIALSDKRYPQRAWDSATERDVDEREAELEAKVTRLDSECSEAKAEGDEVAYQESYTLREKARNELQKLRRAKGGAIKPNGQPRELNKPNANAHEGIRGAIRRAVKQLNDRQLKRLYLHFDAFAKPDGTGTGYVYCPVPTVTWSVENATPTG